MITRPTDQAAVGDTLERPTPAPSPPDAPDAPEPFDASDTDRDEPGRRIVAPVIIQHRSPHGGDSRSGAVREGAAPTGGAGPDEPLGERTRQRAGEHARGRLAAARAAALHARRRPRGAGPADECTGDRGGGESCEQWPRPVLIAATSGIAVLGAATIVGDWTSATPPAMGLLPLEIVGAVLGCAVLPLTARRPVAVALGLALVAVGVHAVTPAAGTAALRVAARRPLRTALGVACAGIAAQLLRVLWRPLDGLSFEWWALLVVASYAALVAWGAFSQARRAVIASLEDRARRAEDEQARRVAEARRMERTSIAREMHDVLAHRLSLLATYAGAIEFRPDASPRQMARAAGVVRAGAHQALEELREVIGILRDDSADAGPPRSPAAGRSRQPAVARDEDADDAVTAAAGAVQRPQPTLADLRRLVEESRHAGAEVLLDERVADASGLPVGMGRTAYRIVQEGLTNARKHAGDQPVRVEVRGRPGERLVVDVLNALPGGTGGTGGAGGAGASDARPEAGGTPGMPGSGTGLIGLAERVLLSDGDMAAGLTAAGEFRLSASLPWPR